MSCDWNESLGCAIESAAGSLPEGYRIRLYIEKHGYDVHLIFPDDTVGDTDGEGLIDEIESLIVLAKRHHAHTGIDN